MMLRALVSSLLAFVLVAATAVAADAVTTSSPLRQGSAGSAVVTLQQQLVEQGFDPGTIDGIFGPRTRRAVVAFQRSKGLAVDGIVGPITWRALGGAAGTATPPATTAASGTRAVSSAAPTQARLRQGSSGSAVVSLQQQLKAQGFDPGAADGRFGPRTLRAVLAFQRARGLAVDGIVGPVTWRALGTGTAAPPTSPTAPPSSTTATTAAVPAGTPSLAAWEALARCESGGRWNLNTGNGYYGGLQFLLSTWRGLGGAGYPHEASKEEQIQRATVLWQRYGWKPWPACTRKLGLR